MLHSMRVLDLLTYRAFQAHPLHSSRTLVERFRSRPLVLASLGEGSVVWAIARPGLGGEVLASGSANDEDMGSVLRAAAERYRARHLAVALARGFLCEPGAAPEHGAGATVRAVCRHPRLPDNAVTFSARREVVEGAAGLAASAGLVLVRTACEVAALLEWVCRRAGEEVWKLDGWFLAGRESAVFLPLSAGVWGEPESDPTPADGYPSAGSALARCDAGRRIGVLVIGEARASRLVEARARLIPMRAGGFVQAWEALASG